MPHNGLGTTRPYTLGALALLALGAAACSTLPKATTSTYLPALSEAPARMGEYKWFYDRDETEHQLFYGLANSDVIPFGLTCQQGSNSIRLSTPSMDRNVSSLSLTSGGQVATYPARAEDVAAFDDFDIVARTTPADPVMLAFAQNGWLAIAEKGQWVGLVGDNTSRQQASRFISGCKR